MSGHDQVTEFSILYEIASMPTRLLDLDVIGEAVVDKATRLLGTDLAVLFLYALTADSLEPAKSRGVRINRVATISLSSQDQELSDAVRAGRVFNWSKHLHSEPIFPPLKVDYPVHEALYIPVGQGEHLLGLIYAARLTERPFVEQELSFFTILADKTATALDNHLLFDESQHQLSELQKQKARLEISNQVGQQIASILTLDDLLTQVVRSIQRRFDYYHFGLWLPSQDAKLMIAYATASRNEGAQLLPSQHISLDTPQSIIGRVYQTGSSYLSNDVSSDPEYIAFTAIPDTRSEIALPLRIGHQIIGVMDIQSDHKAAFDQEDVTVLHTLANQIAPAIRNAQLYKDARQARLEAEEANKIKSGFLASMSHELRTPLNAILNFTEFVALGMMGPVNEAQVDALNKALDSGNHLLALINDVLDMTKIEAGSMKLFIERDIDLHAELEAVTATALSLVSGKSVTFVEDIDKDLPLITGDRRRIRQILLNLISNAAKFTEEGSITLRVRPQDHEVLFSVIDTGPGIALEDQDRIFEPFVQTETGIAHTGGTGLGLPISRRLAEAHGGRLWVESALGSGAAFYVALPVNAQDSSIPSPNVHEEAYAE